jgi:hypothetical protein
MRNEQGHSMFRGGLGGLLLALAGGCVAISEGDDLATCADGYDNDADGKIDALDRGCGSSEADGGGVLADTEPNGSTGDAVAGSVSSFPFTVEGACAEEEDASDYFYVTVAAGSPNLVLLEWDDEDADLSLVLLDNDGPFASSAEDSGTLEQVEEDLPSTFFVRVLCRVGAVDYQLTIDES